MFQNFILLSSSFVSLFWGVTLWCWQKNARSRNIWVIACFLMSISAYVWSVYFVEIDNYALFYKLEVLEAFTTLLLLPMLHFGLKSLASEQPFTWKDYIWLLPAPIITLSLVLLYAQMGEQQAVAYIREIVTNNGNTDAFPDTVFRIHSMISIYLYKIVVFSQIIALLIYATLRLIRYRHRLDAFFSTLENTSIKHQYALLASVYFILLLTLLIYRGRFYYSGDSLFIYILTSVWTVTVYFIGYQVCRLEYTADNLASDLVEADRVADEGGYGGYADTSEQNNNVLKTLLPLFNQIIDEEKPYLQNNLRLDDIARVMRTNRTYISRLINEEFQCSFSDFINKKRIEYAQELMQTNQEMSQEQIAAQSGFSHPSSFSRTFKRLTGTTFRDWQRKNLREV